MMSLVTGRYRRPADIVPATDWPPSPEYGVGKTIEDSHKNNLRREDQQNTEQEPYGGASYERIMYWNQLPGLLWAVKYS